MSFKTEVLVQELMSLTTTLEQLIAEKKDPTEWLELLDSRQAVIDQLSVILQEGEVSQHVKQFVMEKVFQIDLKLQAAITKQKQDLAVEMLKFQQSKLINNEYNKPVNSVYGAFFDKRE
ncbi:MAG: hypothetical protein ACM32O_03050 [Clostridia bacterium]